MDNFTLPFIIESESKDYVLSKCYEEKSECYLLKVEAQKQLESPIWIRINPNGKNSNFKLNIQLGEGSSASIIEDWSPEMKSESISYKNVINCASHSSLKYVILNHSSEQTNIQEDRNSEIANDASCDIYAYHFGSARVASKIQQKTTGTKAKIYTGIIAKTEKTQDHSFNCEHLYSAKDTSGNIEMKGIAQDKAMLNFDGMVNIARTGGGSAGYLQQETLNLSPDTVVKATPGLKIDTNDVKAGHGASVRNLNDEDLFYFGARGIKDKEAKRLLITGFLNNEIQKIKEFTVAYETIIKLV